MRPGLYPILFGGIDPDALAWRSTIIATNAVSPAQLRRVSTLIRALKAAGVWSSLDRLWLFAAENATQALTDLKARATATAVNSPTFTANRGYAGNGSNAYINTGFNPATGTPLYTQNDGSFGVWIETAETVTGSDHHYIANDEAIFSLLRQLNATQYNFGVNASAGTSYTYASQTGHWHAQRTASNAQALFKDGASVATSSTSSAAFASQAFFVLAGNNGGAPFGATNGRLSATWMGGSMGAPVVAAFNNAMRTYMTAVGVG